MRLSFLTKTVGLGALGVVMAANLAAAQCPAADTFEPNDDCLTAVALANGTYNSLTVEGTGGVYNDDFYSVNLPAGEQLVVDCLFLNANGDVDVYFYDPLTSPACGGEAAGDYLVRGFTASDNENVVWNNASAAAMTIIVRVELFSAVACNDYSLVVTTQPIPPGPCTGPDDSFEENDDCASAAVMPTGLTTGLRVSGAAFAVDDDYYVIQAVPNGEILTVDCLFVDATGDIDMTIFSDAACTTQVDGSFSTTDNEQVTASNLSGAPMDFYVRVYGFGTGFDCNNYDMSVTTAPDPCVSAIDDGLEDNDSCATAVALASGAHAALLTTVGDEDYYVLTVPVGEILTVDVTYVSGVSADVDLELFDDLACTNQVDFSFSFGGTGQVTWSNTTGVAASVVLRVAPDATTGSCNNYDLNIVTIPDPCAGTDDVLEDNDDCASATPVSDGTYSSLFTVDGDEDYYEVTVADLDTLTVDILFTDALGDLDLEIYESQADCVLDIPAVGSYGVVDNESVSYTNTTGATVTMVIHVYHWTGDSASNCNTYDMVIGGSGGSFATAMCFGDGSGTPCPCANESVLGAGEGCKSSLGVGAILTANGSASFAADDISFTVTQARALQPSMLVQGSTLIAVPFKDGVLCMGNPTERVEVVFLDANGEGTTATSIITNGNIPGPGATRYYQQWFRDPGGVSPCGNGSNFSNGLTVVYN
ncbi:MAG: hypothetical protein H6831_09625 [Planctomycetes bacterium]|nr:hypothetical protein [Planctomycetota bacterium]MCB9904653.1 hypothetical protein [Planctomycetota bacterium]